MSIIAKIDEQIDALQKLKNKVQAECCHPITAITRKKFFNGGYDSHYREENGNEATCELCKKTWHEKDFLPDDPKKKKP